MFDTGMIMLMPAASIVTSVVCSLLTEEVRNLAALAALNFLPRVDPGLRLSSSSIAQLAVMPCFNGIPVKSEVNSRANTKPHD
jgi:hypothetical protein